MYVVKCRKGTDECSSDFLSYIRAAAWAETFVNRGWTVEIRADASNGLSAQSAPDKGDKAPES